MSESKSPTLQVDEKTKVRLPLLILLALLGTVATAAGAWSMHSSKIGTLQDSAAQHEKRILKIEEQVQDIAVIKNDVQWIRRELERRRD